MSGQQMCVGGLERVKGGNGLTEDQAMIYVEPLKSKLLRLLEI